MYFKDILFSFSLSCISLFFYEPYSIYISANAKGHAYYFNVYGSDSNDGSLSKPWKTVGKFNSLSLHAGDTVFFAGGQVFKGSIFIDSSRSGNIHKPVVITSYGKGKAVVHAGDFTALTANDANYLKLTRLGFTGAGRKTGNTKDGVIINHCSNILLDNIDIGGFQKSGLLIYSSHEVAVSRVYAYENGFAGISISGATAKEDCSNIHVSYCRAENNPGDPANFTNHSGNGIIAGLCRKVVIEYCTATNNGWDMPRKGNGPVGIWCYEADSIIIQHCISYRNKTSAGAADGGGFDLDGGVSNSIIQYCLSYENHGSGFGIFQYAGATNWYNNTIRFCISENDGNVSAAHAGIFIWNSSGDTSQFKNCFIYNNVIYNSGGAAISYGKESANAGFRFYNNIFVAKDTLIIGEETNSVYLGNNWYSIESRFNIAGIRDFNTWATVKGKEQYAGKLAGFNVMPGFIKPGNTTLVRPVKLASFCNYKITGADGFKYKGINLKKLFDIETGNKDFNRQRVPVSGIGASF